MISQTYSVDTNAWLAAGKVVFFLGLEHESSLTTSAVSVGRVLISGEGLLSRNTMLASQDALAKDWASPEEDVAWEGL